jgi:phage terminase large subunit-like protein
VTCELEEIRAMAESARFDVGEENTFKQLNLNLWIKNLYSTAQMPSEVWQKCAFPVVPERLRGRECYGGLDLSHSNDITAFVLVFPPENPDDEDDKYQILPFFWIAEEQMALRIRRDHVNYDQWQRDGFLRVTPGNGKRFCAKKIK